MSKSLLLAIGPALALAQSLLACGSEPFVPKNGTAAQNNAALGSELGTGDGSPASVTFTEIHAAAGADYVDLAFNADDPAEVWVLSYKDDRVHLGRDIGPG